MGNKRTPGDTCTVAGCTEPRDHSNGTRRLVCRKHKNLRLLEARRAARERQRAKRLEVGAVYEAWGKDGDVGKVYHRGKRIIGLRLASEGSTGTYYVATLDSLTRVMLASDALLNLR